MITLDGIIAQQESLRANGHTRIDVPPEGSLSVYPHSLRTVGPSTLFIARVRKEKRLCIRSTASNEGVFAALRGESLPLSGSKGTLRSCPLTHDNAVIIQRHILFTRPTVVGLRPSFGFGDRLGIANAAHLRSLEPSRFVPVLAQQSIRELARTQRTAEDVMDAAVWAVLQEGFERGFGADADHLKTTADIDRMVAAGFTMFTFDPSEHVVNAADSLDESGLSQHATSLPWDRLSDTLDGTLKRYVGVTVPINSAFTITPTHLDVMRALVKYGKAIAHIRLLNDHLVTTHASHSREVEVSVDETDSVTTPFEHLFMASELRRLRVDIVSLAPRFVGDFEKGIDYKGSVDTFTEEYLRHAAIAEKFGPYKISFHSGSDKFAVYAAVGRTRTGCIHVKTAGTSYLEALKVVASRDVRLFRAILDFGRGLYEKEKVSYHVSADPARVRSGSSYADKDLVGLFDSNDVRQVLHVTFGRVLTEKNDSGEPIFKTRLLKCLDDNEDLHYEFLLKHFRRHLEPLEPLLREH